MKKDQLRALFIGAHNDECEYGTGGLAYLLHQAGVKTRFYNTAAVLDRRCAELLLDTRQNMFLRVNRCSPCRY